MGRKACTEPQCLYKGALCLYLTAGSHGLDIRINVVWDMTPRSLAGTYRRFVVYSSLYHQAYDNL